MEPDQNTSLDESALPNVPAQSPPNDGDGTDSLSAPPIADSPAPTPSAHPSDDAAPSEPPPASGWLPPTVPVQASDDSKGDNGKDHASASTAVHVPAPAVADDGDVIEKEWVEKAKQIVMRTRQDPYNQNRELHKFKADYLQKRYNKTIEAVEE
jgi:hypothetical protein